jgi:hypothetical protein
MTSVVMGALFSAALILAAALLQVSPWLSLIVVVGFWFLPFKRILKLFPLTQSQGRIIKPLRERLKQDDPEA